MRALAVLLVCGCTVQVELEGKLCADAGPPCLPGYQCVAGRCVSRAADAGGECAPEPDPAASECAGHTYYLSPAGSDLEDGGSPSTARRTLLGLGLQPGDVVQLLPGSHAQPLRVATSGTRQCPLLVRGEPDGGSVLTQTFGVDSSNTVVRSLTFAAGGMAGVTVGQADRVTFQQVRFELTASYALRFDGTCSDCAIRDSVFATSDGVALTGGNGTTPRLSLRGNRFALRQGEGFVLRGPGIVVSGNTFTGEYNLNDGVLVADPGTLITRNVFHDVRAFYGDKVMLAGGRITHNTFAGVRDATVALVRGAEQFDSNLVTETDHVLDRQMGGFNIYDSTVDFVSPDGGISSTDRVAEVRFDGLTFIPAAGSAAIDSADPSDPVPPGGGPRADVGAFERGAAGSCLPDGGRL